MTFTSTEGVFFIVFVQLEGFFESTIGAKFGP